MTITKPWLVTSLALAGVVALAGCGAYSAAHDFNAPTPVKTWRPAGGWVRIETPGNFPPSAVFACRGRDGLYATMDASSTVIAVPNDPECAR